MSKLITLTRNLTLWLLALCMLPIGNVWATQNTEHASFSHFAQASTASISKSRAAALARSAHGGKVLNVERVESGGRVIYRVKLLLDGGRIRIVTVDGSSGKVV